MANTSHKHKYWLAYFKETTVCTGPADWAASGIPIDHISCDISGIKSTYVDDPTLSTYGQGVNTRQVLEGARNIEFKFGTTLYGLGVSPAVDEQATANAMTDLFDYALGGSHYSNTTTCTGGTATAPILDSIDNIAVGQLLPFQDQTSPTQVTQVHWREVTAIDEMTGAVTLHCALPFTPANTDSVYGCGTFYIDEDELESAVGATKTLSWYIKRHRTDADFVWEARGCVHALSIDAVERNQPAKLSWSVMGGNYKYSDEDGLSNVTFATPQFGFAPLATPRATMVISDASGTTLAAYDVSSYAIDLGVGRAPVECITETINTFEGLSDWTVKFGNTELTVVIPKVNAQWYAAIKAGTAFNATLYQGARGAGKTWCIHLRDCELIETPSVQESGEVLGTQIKLRAKPTEDAETAMAVSRVLLGVA